MYDFFKNCDNYTYKKNNNAQYSNNNVLNRTSHQHNIMLSPATYKRTLRQMYIHKF